MKTLITLCLIIILIGCTPDSSDNNSQPPQTASHTTENQSANTTANLPEGDIMPLNVGHSWTYQMFQADTTSGKMNPTRKITYSITQDTVINSEVWYLISGMGPSGTWSTIRKDGFWIYGPTGQPVLLAKYPGAVGDEFSRISGPAIIINRIEAIGENITVPAGNYFCYKYAQEFGGKNRTTYSYYTPGTGMVRLEIMNESLTKAVMIGELIETTVK